MPKPSPKSLARLAKEVSDRMKGEKPRKRKPRKRVRP